MVKRKSKKEKVIEKICFKCGFPIEKRDRWTLIGTYDDGKTIEEICFHVNCWKDYFNRKVIESAERNVNKTFGKVLQTFQGVASGNR